MDKQFEQTIYHLNQMGISYFPTDKDKRPLNLMKWGHLQERSPLPGEFDALWASASGISTIGGRVSRGLEILDFDNKGGVKSVFHLWRPMIPEPLYAKLVINSTPSGGMHVRYFCPEADLKTTPDLAQVKVGDKWKSVIETKAEGGYALIPPSSGYEWTQGDILSIPIITLEERNLLIDAARSFDNKAIEETPEFKETQGGKGFDERPGDKYNKTDEFKDVLKKHGWECVRNGDRELWRRPGKDTSWSATFNTPPGRFFCFSTNCDPFVPRKPYDPFAVYTTLEHGGDFVAAARALGGRGRNGRSEGKTGGDGGSEKAAGETPKATATDSQPSTAWIESIEYTDGWRAKWFVQTHGENVRWCDEWGKWLIYDGARWQVDKRLEILLLAKSTTSAMLRDAANRIEQGESIDKEFIGQVKKADSRSKYEAMLALVKPEVSALAEDFDAHPFLLNVQNGTIDLKTGQITEHKRDNHLTKIAPVSFDESAECPKWLAFLDKILGGSASNIEFLQRAIGYSLTGEIREQVLLIMYGHGANGKTTFTEAVRLILGEYSKESEPDLLIQKRHETHSTGIADLFGARFVSTSEIGENVRLNEPLVKRLTGGDRLKARHLYQDFFEFDPTHKLWIAVNHKPVVKGTDLGIWRRIRLIPFEVTIPESEQVPKSLILESFKEESSGILNWMIKGCLDWQTDGLNPPDSVKSATNEYREEMDIVGRFLDECCIRDKSVKSKSSALFKRYQQWLEENGENAGWLSTNKAFSTKLLERGIEKRRENTGVFFIGVGILGDESVGFDEPYTEAESQSGSTFDGIVPF